MGNGKCLDDAGRISFMMTAPGTLKNKVATSGMHGYVDNFINAMDLYVEHSAYFIADPDCTDRMFGDFGMV